MNFGRTYLEVNTNKEKDIELTTAATQILFVRRNNLDRNCSNNNTITNLNFMTIFNYKIL